MEPGRFFIQNIERMKNSTHNHFSIITKELHKYYKNIQLKNKNNSFRGCG